ncbi:hypothetical protein Hanom_Chr05g00440791 [Helianthus anomalus]
MAVHCNFDGKQYEIYHSITIFQKQKKYELPLIDSGGKIINLSIGPWFFALTRLARFQCPSQETDMLLLSLFSLAVDLLSVHIIFPSVIAIFPRCHYIQK